MAGPDDHRRRAGAAICEPLGGVHDVAHGGVVAAGPQRADEHLAGVDADAHLHRHVGVDLGPVGGERLLHAQRGPHGPLGVVLVGDRRAEQGDDGVADDLVDPAAERGRCRATSRSKQRVDQVLDLLGVGRSLSAVKPTRSANSTVATRRSSRRVTSGWPHVEQKRAPVGDRRHRSSGRTSGQHTGGPADALRGHTRADGPTIGSSGGRTTVSRTTGRTSHRYRGPMTSRRRAGAAGRRAGGSGAGCSATRCWSTRS